MSSEGISVVLMLLLSSVSINASETFKLPIFRELFEKASVKLLVLIHDENGVQSERFLAKGESE